MLCVEQAWGQLQLQSMACDVEHILDTKLLSLVKDKGEMENKK